MIDGEEWDWIVEHSSRRLRPPNRGQHPAGVHGPRAPPARGMERGSVRRRLGTHGGTRRRTAQPRAVDLEHWPAFHDSFEQFVELLRIVSRGLRGKPPATITVSAATSTPRMSAEVALGTDIGASRVYQIVCSPFRNPLTPSQRRVVRATSSRLAGAVFSLFARACGVAPPTATWTLVSGPTFDNSIGELELNERTASGDHQPSSRPAQDRPSPANAP